MKKLLFILVLSSTVLAGGLVAPKAEAISGSNFNAGRIMDDGIFFNGNTMSANDIQAFLNSKVPSCDTNGSQPHGGTTRAAYGTSRGYPPPYTCLRNYAQNTTSRPAEAGLCNAYGGGSKTAAQIIYDVSRACGVNPKSLIVLLEKEQSLVTDDWPWSVQYQKATGFGCPDTAPCDAEFGAFFDQIYYAARQFKKYDRDESSFRYRPNRTNYIQYNPNEGCGGSNVYLQNQATAGLYNYTPYQPNAAALNNLYGTGDGCSAYGNRNFWRLFHDWFGTTLANCTYPSSTDGQTFRLFNPNTNSYFLTSDPFEVCVLTGKQGYISDATLFYAKSGVSTPVYRLEKNGRYLYTISATERNAAVNNHGFRLEGVGFYAATDSQGGTLRPVYRLSYAPTGAYMYTLSATERDMMVSRYGFKSEGISFYAYNDSALPLADIHRLAHPTSGYLFTSSTSEKNNAVALYGFRNEGVSFRTRTGFIGDNLPVYRLTRGVGYVFTTDFGERKAAMRLGYRSEGIGFFAYPTSNLGASKQVYRLSHPNGNYLYTTSTAENNSAVHQYGYRLEGVVYRTP
jgi:hypothetical protein